MMFFFSNFKGRVLLAVEVFNQGDFVLEYRGKSYWCWWDSTSLPVCPKRHRPKWRNNLQLWGFRLTLAQTGTICLMLIIVVFVIFRWSWSQCVLRFYLYYDCFHFFLVSSRKWHLMSTDSWYLMSVNSWHLMLASSWHLISGTDLR